MSEFKARRSLMLSLGGVALASGCFGDSGVTYEILNSCGHSVFVEILVGSHNFVDFSRELGPNESISVPGLDRSAADASIRVSNSPGGDPVTFVPSNASIALAGNLCPASP
jgi:hypothetical protein